MTSQPKSIHGLTQTDIWPFWTHASLLGLHALDLVVLVIAPGGPLRHGILVQCHVEVGHNHQATAIVPAALGVLTSPRSVLRVLLLQTTHNAQPSHLCVGSLCLELLACNATASACHVVASLLPERESHYLVLDPHA